ncbi:unnamed protein product [Anisakis simplex]|uniref:SRCR domain-containing protein n=1 Tax=Anisakis simplex TaxID=6269 RepID=A0A0M3JXY3_ANISI|nr:unnamed protein product [Anisakis simplex]
MFLEDCDLKWQGSWYLSERSTPVVINATWVDSLGRCVAMSQHDHHYLFHLNSAIGSCYRCVAFFPVHKNVLQFKKRNFIVAGCMRSIINDKNIAAACRRSFRGDAPMTTLFRVNASSERCPFEAPLNFTYLVTDGPCTSRTSTVTVCANPHRYRFQYQACPEIAHTETHAEHIECIAKWNSFGIEYFSAKITNGITPNPSSRFRCIIHERASSGGRMGISADASCNELTDISFANTILKYKQDEWIEQWHRQNKSVSICIDEENLGIAHKFIVHAVNGCTSGYQCVKVEKCPVKGRHSRSDCPMSSVRIGCPHEHSIQLRPYCNSNRTRQLIIEFG